MRINQAINIENLHSSPRLPTCLPHSLLFLRLESLFLTHRQTEPGEIPHPQRRKNHFERPLPPTPLIPLDPLDPLDPTIPSKTDQIMKDAVRSFPFRRMCTGACE
jgi:hypothetical protein